MDISQWITGFFIGLSPFISYIYYDVEKKKHVRSYSSRNKRLKKKAIKRYFQLYYGYGINGNPLVKSWSYNPVPILKFTAICECPQCNWIDCHPFKFVTNTYITRECVRQNCDRRWKQER